MTESKTDRRQIVLGSLAAVGAAMCYGTVAVIARKIVGDFAPPLVATAFSLTFGTLIVGVMFYRHALDDFANHHVPGKAWLWVALAGCASVWGGSFLFLALTQAPVVLVAPASGTSPLVAIVLTYVFLQGLERVTWRTVLGAALVVGGVALVTIGSGG